MNDVKREIIKNGINWNCKQGLRKWKRKVDM
jgi:hypothetical protein